MIMKKLTTLKFSKCTELNSLSNYQQIVFMLANKVIYNINELLSNGSLEYDLNKIDNIIGDGLLDHIIESSEFSTNSKYHLGILKYSSNSDYAITGLFDEKGLGVYIKENGLNGFHKVLSFYALLTDVRAKIDEQLY